MLIDLLFKISLPFTTLGLLAFIYYTFSKENRVFAVATMASVIAFLCLSFILVIMIANYGLGISFVQGARYLIFSWLIIVVYFLAEFRYKIRLLGSVLIPIALMLMLISSFADKHTTGIVIPFGSLVTFIHIGLILVGLALLLLSFASALLYLAKRRDLKNHRSVALDEEWLPSLTKLKGLMEMSFNAGFPAFTVGLILGIIYAGSVLKSGWIWDSKIIWGLINWFIYSALFFLRQLSRLNNRTLARGIVLLFIFIIASFLLASHSLPLGDPDEIKGPEAIGEIS